MLNLLKNLPALIFGLFFVAGGSIMLYQLAWPSWQDWRMMQSWQPAQGELLQVSTIGNDTKAKYRYTVDGTEYENDRVYVMSFTDNIGSYHADLQQRLRSYKQNDTPVALWFNPGNPQQAIIDRNMRWGLFALVVVFCSIFIFIGGLVAYASMSTSKPASTRSRPSLSTLRSEWNSRLDEPGFQESFIAYSQSRIAEYVMPPKAAALQDDWQSRKGWESENILSEAKFGLKSIWTVALIFAGVSLPVLFAFVEEWAKQNYFILLTLLFPVSALYLVYIALAKTREYRHFGKVPFEMDPYPGAIGGNVGGRIKIKHWRRASGSKMQEIATVRLECIYTYMSSSGKNSSRKQNIKWAQEGTPKFENTGSGRTLVFRFDIPDGLPAADVDQSDSYHFWRLSVQAEQPDVDFDRKYNVPVFPTGEKSRYVRHDISAQAVQLEEQKSNAIEQAIAVGDFDIPGLSRAMQVSDTQGELQLKFPMFRNKALTLFAAIFSAAFGFASYSILGELSAAGIFGLLMGLFVIPFVLVALLATIALIYLPFNNLRVTINSDQISVLRRLLFVPIYQRQFTRSEIRNLSIRRSGSTGQGVDKIAHYKILANINQGGSVTIAEDIDGEDAATHFKAYLERRLKLL